MPSRVRSLRPRSGRRRGYRASAFALPLLLLALTLGACNVVQTSPAPPPPPSTSLSVDPTVLNGVTRATVHVGASGSWSLTSDHPGWVSLDPASGSGATDVSLTVDPSGLQPASYAIRLTLQAADGSHSVQLPFSFPDATVTVTRGDTLSSQALARPATTANAKLHAFGSGPGDLIVGVAKVPAQAPALQLASIRAGQGVRVRSAFASAGVVTVHVQDMQAAARRIAGLPGVRYVEAPQRLEPFSNDPYRSQQWNLDTVRAEQAWPSGDGTGTTIAVLDTGFDPSHPDLAANVAGTYNAVTGGSDVAVTNSACGSHGTHVAGIAAAVANNGVGIAGAAPGAKLLLVDIGNASQSGCPMTSTALISALQYVTNAGGTPRARVVNMSLGATNDLGQGVRDALTAAQQAGIVLVAAAGNDQTTQPTPVAYPAAYPQVLAVGATTPSDTLAFYSDRGPQLWVVAPGGGTATDAGTKPDMILSTWYDFSTSPPTETYAYDEGTSMASPLVAALAAQLLTSRPAATPDQIATALAQGATDLGAAGRDATYGYGLVDAVNSKAALAATSPLTLHTSDGRTFDVVRGVPFTVPNLPVGNVTFTAGTDDNGDGTLGDAGGELLGRASASVAFDAASPDVSVTVTPQ